MSGEWQRFFLEAGIPSAVAGSYANSFKQNRIAKSMLKDLDKSTLAELGVTAIGDQLAILRRIKDMGNLSLATSIKETYVAPKSRQKISGPGSEIPTASSVRKGRPPPDRNEIYHIKMPEGNTSRTKKILARHEALRRQGLAIRGTTGVRQAGRDVSPVDKSSTAARIIKRDGNGIIERLGVRGLHADSAQTSVLTGRINKRGGNQPRKVMGNDMRIVAANAPRAGIVNRMNRPNGGPTVTVSLDGGSRRGALNNRLQLHGKSGNRKNINNRIVFDNGVNMVDYEDVIYQDDMDYGDEYIEYIEKPSIYDRLSR